MDRDRIDPRFSPLPPLSPVRFEDGHVSRRYGIVFVCLAYLAVIFPARCLGQSCGCESRHSDWRFLSDAFWIAEADRCTEPPFAIGTCALEFWTFPESELGSR